MPPGTRHHLRPAATVEVLTGDPGCAITLLADTPRLTVNRSRFGVGGAGAPPHVHATASELFVVLDGRLDVLLDDDVITLDTGDVLDVPPGQVHAFGAARGHTADVLFVFTPGVARFDYYRLLDAAHRGLAPWAEVTASGARFDNRYVESPTWDQWRTGRADDQP